MNIEYLAGFFDADGYVGVVYHKTQNWYSLRLTITNTNKLILQKFQMQFGGKIQNKCDHRKPEFSDYYHLCWSGSEALQLLAIIGPHLSVKKSQAELALTFPMGWHVKDKQKEIYDELKIMKRPGV